MKHIIEINNNKIITKDYNNTLNKNENEKNLKIFEKIVNLKLKIFFKYLISIFKKRDNIIKVQFFYYLQSLKSRPKEKIRIKDKNNKVSQNQILTKKEINKLLSSHIVFYKISTSLKNIFYIYKSVQFRKKLKYLEFWRRYTSLCSSLEVEINSKNSYDKKISDLNKKIKNMNKIRDNLKLDEKKISQSLQVKEEQKNTKQKNIKILSNKYKQLQREKEKDFNNNNKVFKNNILNMNNTNATNSIKTRESEEKFMELETSLRQIKEEELNNDKNFKDFMNNVEKNLNNYETKALNILGQKRKKNYENSLDNKNSNNINNIQVEGK